MKLKKRKILRWLSLYLLAALGFAVCFIIGDWFPIFGTLFISPSSLLKTTGVIYKSNADILQGGEDSAGLVRGQHFKICHYKIYYSFSIDGKIYRSRRINFLSANYLSCNEVKEYVKKYYVGKSVNVYYMSSSPWISVLEPQNKINFSDYLLPNFSLPYGIVLFIIIPFLIGPMNGVMGTMAKHQKSDATSSNHHTLPRNKKS